MANAIPVLVVDDDAVSSAQLGALAKAAGYDVRSTYNGREAWELLQVARIPIVISDWYMPEMDGPELCRRIRSRVREPYVYFILVTARGGKQQYLAGMEAGADDFIAKPVDPDELRARLKVAERILGLRKEIEQLEVLLPICSYCKRIRNDKEEWEPLEQYIEQHFEQLLSHGICPDCYIKYVQPQLDRGPSSCQNPPYNHRRSDHRPADGGPRCARRCAARATTTPPARWVGRSCCSRFPWSPK